MRIYIDFKSKPTYGPIIDVVNHLALENEVLYSHSKQFRLEGLDDNIVIAGSNRDIGEFKPQVVFSAYSSFPALVLNTIAIKAPIVNYRFIHTSLKDILSAKFKKFPIAYKIRILSNLVSYSLPKRFSMPDQLLLPNNLVKQELMEIGFSEDRLRVLQWGFLTEKYDAFASSASSDPIHDYILYAGPLHDLRFSLNLVDAFAEISGKHSNAILSLLFRRVWDKSLLQKVYNKVRQKGIDSRVRILTTPLTHYQLMNYINRAAVVVLTYFASGIVEMPPLTLLESMALSKPIITNQGIATSEIIQNGYNGVVINQDTRALANAIDSLLSNRNRAISLGLKAKHSVERNFSFRKFCERLEDTLECVI